MGDGVEFSPAVRELVRARCGGRCERCGAMGWLELHHRLYRSRGGLGGPENAAALCGFGNASGCHGIAHSIKGELDGWSVALGGDPEGVPLRMFRFGSVLLTADGLVRRAEGLPCWPHLGCGPVEGCAHCECRGAVVWDVADEKGWI